jgi:hypothetical protein
MTHQIARNAKAMTAIAAALVLLSTASFAQDTGTTPDPVAAAPAAETSPSADPLAPEPAAEQAPAAAEAPPLVSRPKVETPLISRPKVETRTAAKPAKVAASAPAARATVRRASMVAAAPAPAATPPAAVPAPIEMPPAPAPVAEAQPPAPVAEAQPPAPEPASPPIAEPAAASDMASAMIADMLADDRLPYAGGAALGLLALGGAGIASRRRKRRRENEQFEARTRFLDLGVGEAEAPLELTPADEVRPGPAFRQARAPVHDSDQAGGADGAQLADAPAAGLPDGFDLSRFGPHVQAAYRGPTPDNPSLSLKHRVRRAAALDQQEGRAAKPAGPGRAAQGQAGVPTRGNWESRPDADFLFRRSAKPAEREVEHR